jgi:HEAT repeat protein
VCTRYGPWEGALGPTPEVQAALAGLERLDSPARRQAAADLARRRPVAEASLPPLLRAEVAAAAMPDDTPLRALLDDPSAHLREAACRVAGLRRVGRLLAPVRACVHDPVPWVRTAAVLACADLGDDSIRGALEERLEAATRAGNSPTRLLEALGHVANRESAVVLRRIRPSLAPSDQELADEILEELTPARAFRARGPDSR